MSFINSVPFYAGTSNVVLPVPNKECFPEEFKSKSRLCYYGSLFNSVEINSTFYKLPLARTIERWATEVPDNFKFTFKLWQEVTHCKGRVFDPENIDRFMHIVNHAGEKKGSLLIQFPPSVTISIVTLTGILSQIRLADPNESWHVAVEFRNKSWYNDTVFELLDQYKASMVLHDMPASAAPLEVGEADFVYLRFHGPEGGYRGSYTDDFLSEYASYVKEWLEDGKTVYAYFNNTMGAAVQNLITLNDFVKEAY
ncbi:DUF72 domain-containing protein [Mucilaginibacter sp. PAMB04168]|uniref:DUF72 domain-containing protein n=1 Tax=Mucilaginibacter sp. PAMB04168 TaxID=3138567 RepID=UPI0031F6A2EA